MLKIKDSTGKVVGVLKDEDSSPDMDDEEPEEVTEEDKEEGEE